jgi:hypothetical protein
MHSLKFIQVQDCLANSRNGERSAPANGDQLAWTQELLKLSGQFSQKSESPPRHIGSSSSGFRSSTDRTVIEPEEKYRRGLAGWK